MLDRGKHTAATIYSNTAKMITLVNPYCTAINAANTALTTEAHPLIAHAQGIRLWFDTLISDNATGNGIPMNTATGQTSNTDKIIFQYSGKSIR